MVLRTFLPLYRENVRFAYTAIEIFKGERCVFGSLLFVNRFYAKKLPSELRNMGDEVDRIWVESASCNFFKVSYPFEVSRLLQ